jgi:hypothetical protein
MQSPGLDSRRVVKPRGVFIVLAALCLWGCGDDGEEDGTPDRFAASSMQQVLGGSGYIDSIFLTKDASRLSFTRSIFRPLVLLGVTPPACCPVAAPWPGQVSAPGLEWNTDLYYVEWNGAAWSSPVNVGTGVNTLGIECCVWVNDDETEIIFYRDTDLDGDGSDEDLGLPATGTYVATRAATT